MTDWLASDFDFRLFEADREPESHCSDSEAIEQLLGMV